MAKLRKWYFCINERGFRGSMRLMRVAIKSCLANTALQPICIYNGEDQGHVNQLGELGVQVIRHTSSLEPLLRQGYGDNYDKFSGHWLRVDIPFLETEDDVVLYADIDVMFREHPRPWITPRYLGAAPETNRFGLRSFNSGVMVMNLPNLRAIHAGFRDSIAARMEQGWEGVGHDQVSYNRFFRKRYARIQNSLNWKPYWGVNPSAQIVHFHGPKPAGIARLELGNAEGLPPKYIELWKRNKAGYAAFCDEARTFMDAG